jgi:hypothetical protein
MQRRTKNSYLFPLKRTNFFCEGKTPIEVAIELNLRESEATRFCSEYWNLKRLHNLNTVYEEIKDDIGYFVKLYKLAKSRGMVYSKLFMLLELLTTICHLLRSDLKS